MLSKLEEKQSYFKDSISKEHFREVVLNNPQLASILLLMMTRRPRSLDASQQQ